MSATDVPDPNSDGKQLLRLKGKGVVDSKDRAGDLYAVLEIVAPKADDLSEDDRKALASIANNLPNPRSLVSWAGEIPDA